MPPTYPKWFEAVSGYSPHAWQAQLGAEAAPMDRLIRIPTGMGKTAGTVLAWLYHRLILNTPGWPTRLVFTLPMRVLVEQCAREVEEWIAAAGLAESVDVELLMGGAFETGFALDPARPAVLIGTQDMLLSRALNRGYGAARGRWPVDFGLLNADTLWVLDEVQLMGVGLITSAQLCAFRQHLTGTQAITPSRTWWMSATLQPGWLSTPETEPWLAALTERALRVPPAAREGSYWETPKALALVDGAQDPKEVAALVAARHKDGLTLVILNRVERALDVYRQLDRHYSGAAAETKPDLRLVHSRFRGHERAEWSEFLHRDATPPAAGQILVATQVVEAGVDISARLLVTDLAPWASLVQRFGRCARYPGESGEVVVLSESPATDKAALPYSVSELAAAKSALQELEADPKGLSRRRLEEFEERAAAQDPQRLSSLYPYAPRHVLLERDLLQLFDTSADLSGADIDVSRYVRSGESRDVLVFWREPPENARRISNREVSGILGEEICRVPVAQLKDWLEKKQPRAQAYRLDFVTSEWVRATAREIVPGQRYLIPCQAGGYTPRVGWDSSAKERVEPVRAPEAAALGRGEAFNRTAEAADDDTLSETAWQTIAEHGADVASLVAQSAARLAPDYVSLLALAARWHDLGKAHEVFQAAILPEARQAAGGSALGADLAKAPPAAWRRPRPYARPGFRHELASGLALLEFLRRIDPGHAALFGELQPLLEAGVFESEPFSPADQIDRDAPLARELVSLSKESLDLVAYLVISHHGKVRTSLRATPQDQGAGGGIQGVWDGDQLPPTALAQAAGEAQDLPALQLSLAPATLGLNSRYGASWGERVAGLLERHGPFELAYLEALLRGADVRASMALEGAL